MKDKLIGIDLGGTTIKFAILKINGDIQQKWSIKTNILNDGQNIVPDIIKSIEHHIDLYKLDKNILKGIGIGTPGVIDDDKGTVKNAFNLGWKTEQSVRKDIEDKLHLPVNLENDANAAALGEQWKGSGNNESNVVFITLGTGVGGGIVANDNLLHGIANAAGEIGHIIVEPNGYLCTCGNKGCLEQYASATGIVRLAQDLSEEYVGVSILKKMINNGDEVTAKIVFDLAKKNDYLAQKVANKVAFYLGLACANLANTLNPSSIIIGGGVSAAGTFLIEKVENYFNQFAFAATKTTTKIMLAELGNDAGCYGAGLIAKKSERKINKY